MTSSARIVVTGLGAVTPHGVGVEPFWNGIIQNRSAVRTTKDPVLAPWAPVVADVPDFEPSDFLSRKTVRDTARFSQMALVAAMEAVRDAGLTADEGWNPGTSPDRTGVFMGTSFGSIRNMDDAATELARDALARVEPRLVSKSIPNAAGSSVAIHFNIQGPVLTYTTACASSANSIGEAASWIQSGRVDVALAGGSDCLFASTLLAGLRASGALVSHGPDDHSRWSRPFDIDRSGMVMGEGAAILVLEPLERALARGAHIYAELVGYGTSNDAFHQIA
ncbi:MAG: beta-ketoacyl-[acyl-carrier-protein] synthase family protein, partial [Alicyclobacillus shizuokensis]|nr:beta-ketoacyl-[acyl-carrier-protein] synthase family protein [Alicyclobacillus shizuokensis]